MQNAALVIQKPSEEKEEAALVFEEQQQEGKGQVSSGLIPQSGTVPLPGPVGEVFDTPAASKGDADAWRREFGVSLRIWRVRDRWQADVNLSRCLEEQRRGWPLGKQVPPQHGWEVLSVERTFERLIGGSASISRYGDGEFGVINGDRDVAHGMERGSKRLAEKLERIANLGGQPDTIGLCVGLMPVYDIPTLRRMDKKGEAFFTRIGRSPAMAAVARCFPSPGLYCSTSVTRVDHRPDLGQAWFVARWRHVFAGKLVVFVGPTVGTHFREEARVHPDGVFKCAAVVYHVPVPRQQAFAGHDDHVASALQAWRAAGEQHPRLERMVVVVAGPLGTALH